MSISAKESVSYLRGYIDGLEKLGEKEKKLYDAILNALDAITKELEEHNIALDDIDDTIEDIYFTIDGLSEERLLPGEAEDDDFIEVECPHCNETVLFDSYMMDSDSLICPICNEEIELFGDEDEDEDLEF